MKKLKIASVLLSLVLATGSAPVLTACESGGNAVGG